MRAERATGCASALGIVLHGSGWLVDFVAYHGVAPMPSFSDPLWLGAYLGFYPGVVLLGRERFARRGVGMWLDGLLGGLALGRRHRRHRAAGVARRTWTPPAAPPSPAPPTRWPTSRC